MPGDSRLTASASVTLAIDLVIVELSDASTRNVPAEARVV
jgi:hypothetical protein